MSTRTMPTEYNSPIHPKKFALWLGLASIVMMFAGLTSAVIVRRSAGNWTSFKLPDIFITSTIVVVLSSIIFQLAYFALKKEKIGAYRIGISLTFLLGIAFTICQIMGWNALTDIGIRLRGNPSGSFLYLISGVHLIHLLFGLLVLSVLFIKSFIRKDAFNQLLTDISPERYLGIQLALTYWHFVGILWVYLFFFFRKFLI